MSSTRVTCAVVTSSGSPSTLSRTIEPSGGATIVWPVRASPYASSGYTIGQVSWKPLRTVPASYAGVPSSGAPRTPR